MVVSMTNQMQATLAAAYWRTDGGSKRAVECAEAQTNRPFPLRAKHAWNSITGLPV